MEGQEDLQIAQIAQMIRQHVRASEACRAEAYAAHILRPYAAPGP